jgi:hypothetical protein
MWKAEEWGHL